MKLKTEKYSSEEYIIALSGGELRWKLKTKAEKMECLDCLTAVFKTIGSGKGFSERRRKRLLAAIMLLKTDTLGVTVGGGKK